MQCTKEEIAEKRRIAVERRQANLLIQSRPQQNKTPVASEKSKSQFNLKATSSVQIPQRYNPYLKPGPSKIKEPHKGSSPSIAPIFVKTCSCKVYMVSEDRFALENSCYSEEFVEVCKTIPSRSYGKSLIRKEILYALIIYDLNFRSQKQIVVILNKRL